LRKQTLEDEDDDENEDEKSLMIDIREAESRDAPAILELYRQLVRPVAPDLAIDVRAERIEQIRRDPHNFLWVIESDQEVLGTVFITLCLDPMYSQQPYALLENFVIHEGHRTKGYGALLMRHAEDFCYRADCSKIMLQSHGSRVEAHAFFEAQGFSANNKKGFVKYRSQMEHE
jgi:N-acetylglutamate synthase-like GNAT family acetyltransferase